MREFTIGPNDKGQRLDRWLQKNLPLLPASLAQKYIRLKRVKLNGAGAKRDTRLNLGDTLALYINDEFFDLPTAENAYLSIVTPHLSIVYEDENLILADKRPGMLSHPDETERVNTLITHIQAYLYQKKEWRPREERSFAPALCNRIDRNTGGIVIAAKNAETLRIINEKIAAREIEKYYLCIIHGSIKPPAGILEDVLFKDEKRRQVFVQSKPVPGARSARTEYKTLASREDLSLLECHLLTGRTHQIRAQMANAGHPLLGDGKYGSERANKPYGRSHQALYSYKLSFAFSTDAGLLSYLNGKTVSVPEIDFVTEFFLKARY